MIDCRKIKRLKFDKKMIPDIIKTCFYCYCILMGEVIEEIIEDKKELEKNDELAEEIATI